MPSATTCPWQRRALLTCIAALSFAQASEAEAQPGAATQDDDRSWPVENDDPAADYGLMAPTGILQPKNAITFHDRMVLIPAFTVSPSSRFQFTLLTALAPGLSLGAEFKIGLIRRNGWHVALSGHAGAFLGLAINIGLGGAFGGVTATRCLGPSCDTMLTGSLMGGRYSIGSTDTSEHHSGLYAAAAVQKRVTGRYRLLLESQGFFDRNNGYVLTLAGVRLHGRRTAVDLGILVTLHDQGGWHVVEGLMGPVTMPCLNLTHRWE